MGFKGPGGYGRVLNTFMNIIICGAMNFYVMWVIQNLPQNAGIPILTLEGYLAGFVMSFCCGYYIGDTVPGWMWGNQLAAKLKLGKIPAFVFACAFHGLCMCTLIPLLCNFINNFPAGGLAGVWQGYALTYFPVLGMGFLLMLVFMPIALKLAKSISGFDPDALPPAPPQA